MAGYLCSGATCLSSLIFSGKSAWPSPRILSASWCSIAYLLPKPQSVRFIIGRCCLHTDLGSCLSVRAGVLWWHKGMETSDIWSDTHLQRSCFASDLEVPYLKVWFPCYPELCPGCCCRLYHLKTIARRRLNGTYRRLLRFPWYIYHITNFVSKVSLITKRGFWNHYRPTETIQSRLSS